MIKKSVTNSLSPCIVHNSNGWETFGLLYFENERVVVLLNNLVQEADLGPIKYFCNKHVEPEATIVVIPRDQVRAIKILQEVE
jgi:hypothetical protein